MGSVREQDATVRLLQISFNYPDTQFDNFGYSA